MYLKESIFAIHHYSFEEPDAPSFILNFAAQDAQTRFKSLKDIILDIYRVLKACYGHSISI